MDDEILIEKIRNGDNLSASILYNKYYFLAKKYIPQSLKNTPHEDEIINISFFEAIKRWNNKSPFGIYLGTVVRSQSNIVIVREHAQKRDVSKTVSIHKQIGEDMHLEDIIHETDSFDNFETEELRNIINLTNLTEFQKKLIYLSLKGYTNREIAEILNSTKASVGTIKPIIARKIRETKERHSQITSFLNGNGTNPIIRAKGNDRKEYVRLFLEELSWREGTNILDLKMDLIGRYSLYPPGYKRRKPSKNEILSYAGIKVPFFALKKTKKWDDHSPREAILYLLNYHYLFKADLIKKYHWFERLYIVKFNLKKSKMDNYILRLLGLDEKDARKYYILAEITDNDATIFPRNGNNLRENVINHIKTLEEIIDETKFTSHENKALEDYLEGKESKTKYNSDNLRRAINKIRFSAIRRYRENYEKGADIERIKKEARYRFENYKSYVIKFNRYIRYTLQALIEWHCENKGISLNDAPGNITIYDKYISLYHHYFGNMFELFNFTYPGKFSFMDFNIKNKWDNKEEIFKLFDKIILSEKRLYVLSKDLQGKYRKGNIFSRYTLPEIQKEYFISRFRKKFRDEDSFNEYMKKRKLLFLLSLWAEDDEIMKLDLYKVYKMSEVNPQMWDYRLSMWESTRTMNVQVARRFFLSYTYVGKLYNKEKKTLKNVVEYLMKK